MTEFDKILIEIASRISRWNYAYIDRIVLLADTQEARDRLADLRWMKYDSVQETL